MFARHAVYIDFMRFCNLFFRFAVLGLLIWGVSYGYQRYQSSIEDVQPVAKSLSKAANKRTWDVSQEDFEEILDQSSEEQLALLAEEYNQVDFESNPVEQIQIYNRAIQIANLLQTSKADNILEKGILLHLQVRNDMALSSISNRIYDATSNDTLERNAEPFLTGAINGTAASNKITLLAQLNSAFASFIRFVEESRLGENSVNRKKHESKFAELASDHQDSGFVAGRMFDILAIAKKRLQEEQRDYEIIDSLHLKMIDAFSETKSSEVADRVNFEIGNSIEKMLSVREVDDDLGVDRDFLVDRFDEKLNSVLSSQNLSLNDYQLIFRRLERFVGAGFIRQTQKMLENVNKKLALTEFTTAMDYGQQMVRRLRLFGTPLPFEGINKVDGTPATFEPNRFANVVMFFDSSSERAAKNKAATLVKRLGADLNEGELGLAFVWFLKESDQSTSTKRVELSQNLKTANLWEVDSSNEKASRLLKSFGPPNSYPMVVVLNEKMEIVALNGKMKEVVEHVLKLKRKSGR